MVIVQFRYNFEGFRRSKVAQINCILLRNASVALLVLRDEVG